MNSIPRVSLEDTYTLLQLIRETALARGRQSQADALAPVMEEVRTLVTRARPAREAARPPASPGMLGQADFQKLLEVSKAQVGGMQPANPALAAMERNRLVASMSAANMSEIEIARQMGMTRDEVRLVLSIHQRGGGRVYL